MSENTGDITPLNRDLLLDFGAHLYSVDSVQEQNNQGFNKPDYSAWRMAPYTEETAAIAELLKKYKGQLTTVFGETKWIESGMADYRTPKSGKPKIDKRPLLIPEFTQEGDLDFKTQGWISDIRHFNHLAKDFTKSRGPEGNWVRYVPAAQVLDFDIEAARKTLSEIGMRIADVPKISDELRAQLEALKSQAPEDDRPVVRITFDHKTGKYAVLSPYDARLVELFRNRSGQLSGITEFNPTTKGRETYQATLVEEIIEKLESDFTHLRLDATEAREAIQAYKDKVAFEQQAIPEVTAHLNPEITLFAHQNQGVHFMNAGDGNVLFGDTMGLGKTLQSLSWAVMNDQKRVLVVCPKVVRRTWCQEAEKFFPGVFGGKTRELVSKDLKKHGMPDLSEVQLASVNYESVEKFLPAIEAAGFDAIVIDESHRIKNPKAKVTQTLMGIRDLFEHRILLSGTAIKNKRSELATQIEYVRPGFLTAHTIQNSTIGGLWNQLNRENLYLARQKEEVLKDLPALTTSLVELEVPKMPQYMPKHIDEMSAHRALSAKAKVDATHDFVKELLDSSDSHILVFTESFEAACALAEKTGGVLHHGQMSDDARENAKSLFQSGEGPRVMVSTRQSLAVGATLHRADKIVFNDLPWTHSDLDQAQCRCHRIGQPNPVTSYWINAIDNPWDQAVTALVLKKLELAKMVNTGKAVSPEDREWMEKPVSLSDIKAQFLESKGIKPETAAQTGLALS